MPLAKAAAVVPASPPSSHWRQILSFPAVLVGALTYLVFILARRDVPDPDLWWHLRNAQILLTQHHFPLADSYSYTARGAAVLPFEWLSELPFYLAYKWGGLTAVFWLVFALCTAIMLGVFRLSYLASKDVKNSFVVSVGGAVLASITIGAQVLLFGWLLLVVLLLLLEQVRQGAWKWLWLAPPLFCLWANTHGSWPMGMALFAIFIAGGLVEGQWGRSYARRWSGGELRKLLMAAAASVALLFVNPFGYRLVAFPIREMFMSGLVTMDFASVDFHTPWGRVAMVLILGLLAAAVFSAERWRLDEVGFAMVALYYCLTYSRFMFLAGILLPPIFARRLKLMTPYEPECDRPRPNLVALVVLLGLFVVSVPRHGKFRAPVEYPERALAYMRANGMQGRIFHDWVWGGYLIWHTPEYKVFIDGRYDPYRANGVYRDYMAATYGPNPEPVLDKYGIEYVLMMPDTPLTQRLEHDSRWTVRYSDANSVLLQRASGF